MDPFMAEIRIFPFTFAPKGWAFCGGQLMPISQNTALFSLLGTVYGGDGKSTFALPDLQGRAAMHPGQGQGLSQRFLGESSGSEAVTLDVTEIPFHTHQLTGSNENGTQGTLVQGVTVASSQGGQIYQSNTSGNLANMAAQALALAGGSQPHNNMQPYLTFNFCIALQGIFPPRP